MRERELCSHLFIVHTVALLFFFFLLFKVGSGAADTAIIQTLKYPSHLFHFPHTSIFLFGFFTVFFFSCLSVGKTTTELKGRGLD